MSELESAITTKGQATIPKAIREHLRLEPGDRIKFFKHPDGTVVILPKARTSRLRGMVKPRGRKRVSLDDMDAAISAGAAEKARGLRKR